MIPKVIHISWIDKSILFTSNNPLAINGVQNMKRINPEYKIEVSDDNDVDDYIQSCISNDDWLLLKDRHIVEKVDLWRLLKIYYEGGIYCDIDRLCNIPFKDIIKDSDVCILPTYFEIDFSQDIMISEKGQQIHKKAIELNLSRRQTGCDDVLTLGPITYFHSITQTLYGKQMERQPHPALWERIISAVNQTSGYRTFRERVVGSVIGQTTIIYKYDESYIPGNKGTREDLYKESKTVHWTKSDNVFGKKIYGN